MKKNDDYKLDDNKEPSDLDKIKENYQKIENFTGDLFRYDEDKYIMINADFFDCFFKNIESIMKQDNFIKIRNKIENYDGANNIDKEKTIFNEIISKINEIKAKSKEEHEYSRKLLKDILSNCKSNIKKNKENYEIIYKTWEKISKEIVMERKNIYINYERLLLNYKEIIKDLSLFFNIN